FPTRRSSDLANAASVSVGIYPDKRCNAACDAAIVQTLALSPRGKQRRDCGFAGASRSQNGFPPLRSGGGSGWGQHLSDEPLLPHTTNEDIALNRRRSPRTRRSDRCC